MKKNTIIVVEARSSGVSYISDIRKMGYEPIIMEVPVPNDPEEGWRALSYTLNGESVPEIITTQPDYDKTLEMVRGIDPVLIIPGSDNGINLATQLSQDLGLKGEDPERLPYMRKKDLMQEAVRAYGLRSIHSKRISTEEEAVAYYREQANKKAVIKPISGAGSKDVCICLNEEMVRNAVRLNLASASDFVIQEFIEGEEYFCDTVSIDGEVLPTFAMKYHKKLVPGYGMVYDYAEYISLTDPEIAPIVEYAVQATKAVGLRFGPMHGEYKLDDKGPVLIEVNCRPAGTLVKTSFYDETLGFHETDVALRSYLDPDGARRIIKEHTQSIKSCGVYKFIILENDIYVNKIKVEEACRGLPSYRYSLRIAGEAGNIFRKTVDVNTTGGVVYLAGNPEDVHRDLEYIQDLEQHHIEQLFDIAEPASVIVHPAHSLIAS